MPQTTAPPGTPAHPARGARLARFVPLGAATLLSLLLVHGLFRAVAAGAAVFGFAGLLRRGAGRAP